MSPLDELVLKSSTTAPELIPWRESAFVHSEIEVAVESPSAGEVNPLSGVSEKPQNIPAIKEIAL